MNPLILISILCVAALATFCYALFGSAKTAVEQYNNDIKHTASNSLAEMFIFIDDKKLKWISFGAFTSIVLISFLLSESVLISLGFGSAVYFLPGIAVSILRRLRYQKFSKDLPDALLSMSNMMRSGLNLSGALGLVVKETGGPLSQEFGMLLNELTMGRNFDEALDEIYRRVPIPDLELVVAGMKISREVGGSLADVLERLADTIRKRLEMEGKIKSLTAMGVLQGWVMTLLPIIVGVGIYAIEPETMSLLFTDWRGWIACSAVVILEFAGYKFIKKIVTIDV
ncbi:type II secretion system F family protein [Microbulbifer bruguierae]|uniref:Type II secretion system F family protein n=1 Tax=Microbulbifer bruguierae TaxID=3029061 RepID=A0ABY8N936_9GAMM|nr:type II secretion system F family protein [Microbulbifer bruguierae]WGL15420.1 type II secretion system F family protein [Microbulbifer bruguierae]